MSLKHHLQTDWRIEPGVEGADAEPFAAESAARERVRVAIAAAPAKERRAVRRVMEVRIGSRERGIGETFGRAACFGKSTGA